MGKICKSKKVWLRTQQLDIKHCIANGKCHSTKFDFDSFLTINHYEIFDDTSSIAVSWEVVTYLLPYSKQYVIITTNNVNPVESSIISTTAGGRLSFSKTGAGGTPQKTNFSFSSCDQHDKRDNANITTRTASNPQAERGHNQEKDAEKTVSERR